MHGDGGALQRQDGVERGHRPGVAGRRSGEGGSLRLQCQHDMTQPGWGRFAEVCAIPACDLLSAAIDHDGYAADSVDGTIDIEDTTIQTAANGTQQGRAHVVVAIDAVLPDPLAQPGT